MFNTLLAALTMGSSLVNAHAWAGNGTNSTVLLSKMGLVDSPRCTNTSAHNYTVVQTWVRADDYQFSSDCFKYGLDTYEGLKECAQRNVCFGNCSRTYADCLSEWESSPATRAAKEKAGKDLKLWMEEPAVQFYIFSNLTCTCEEVKGTPGHGACTAEKGCA